MEGEEDAAASPRSRQIDRSRQRALIEIEAPARIDPDRDCIF